MPTMSICAGSYFSPAIYLQGTGYFFSVKVQNTDLSITLQVNVASRDAAISPPASDSLSAFKGSYKTHLLPKNAGYPATKGMEISIGGQDGQPLPSLPTSPMHIPPSIAATDCYDHSCWNCLGQNFSVGCHAAAPISTLVAQGLPFYARLPVVACSTHTAKAPPPSPQHTHPTIRLKVHRLQGIPV